MFSETEREREPLSSGPLIFVFNSKIHFHFAIEFSEHCVLHFSESNIFFVGPGEECECSSSNKNKQKTTADCLSWCRGLQTSEPLQQSDCAASGERREGKMRYVQSDLPNEVEYQRAQNTDGEARRERGEEKRKRCIYADPRYVVILCASVTMFVMFYTQSITISPIRVRTFTYCCDLNAKKEEKAYKLSIKMGTRHSHSHSAARTMNDSFIPSSWRSQLR